MIHAVSGKPGGGKSLYGMHLLVKELREGHRAIVTNLPVNAARLNEWLQIVYPNENLETVTRLRVLTEDETREFWKYRDDRGTLFILDEIHLFFNAREWAKTGKDCLFYLSQHRKLSDDVVWITQALANVDKQFRSVTQDFSVIRNGYTTTLGMFRAPGRFTRRTYASEPHGGQEPFEIAYFTLDVSGICSCYDTAAGVGVHGSSADKGKRARGIHIYWAVPGIIALLVIGLVLVPRVLGSFAGKVMPGASAAEKMKKDSKDPDAGAAPAAVASPRPGPVPVNPAASAPVDRLAGIIEPGVYLTGVSVRGRAIRLQFSDGTRLDESSGLIDFASATGAMVRGRWFPVRNAPYDRQSFPAPLAAEWAPSPVVRPAEVQQERPVLVEEVPGWVRGADGVLRSTTPDAGLGKSSFPVRGIL